MGLLDGNLVGALEGTTCVIGTSREFYGTRAHTESALLETERNTPKQKDNQKWTKTTVSACYGACKTEQEESELPTGNPNSLRCGKKCVCAC